MADMDDDDKDEPCERWFKMPRKLFQSEAGSDPYLIQLMAWLCERARFTETSVAMPVGKGLRTFRLLPGELIVGRNSGSDALKWTPSSFRNRLQRLESLGLVTLKTHKKFTIVSVCFLAIEKDNRKRSVKPMNSTGYKNRTESKRTIEGQRGKVDFTNEFASETSSSILGKGQLEDNRRTIEGQLKDTNTEGSECTDESEGSGGEAIRRRSLRYLEIQFQDLTPEVREAYASEMVGAVASGAVDPSQVEFKLGAWASKKRPKPANSFESPRPTRGQLAAEAFSRESSPSTSDSASDSPSEPSPSPPPPPPTLDEVKAYFLKEGLHISEGQWFDHWRTRNWTRRDGSPLTDWRAQAKQDDERLRKPSPSASTPPPPSEFRHPESNRVVTSPQRTAEEFKAELQKVTP